MTLDDVVRLYAQALNVPEQQVSVDTSVFRQGVSSLRAAWLMATLRQELNVDIPKEEFWVGLSPLDVLKYAP